MSSSIYIVEDNEDIGYILDFFLKEEGYNVTLFPTIGEFNTAIARTLPDLFLLDVMLPDGYGIQLCNAVKADFRTEKIPVLIMSAHSPAEKISKESSADGFIKKPFDLNLVLERIQSLLEPVRFI